MGGVLVGESVVDCKRGEIEALDEVRSTNHLGMPPVTAKERDSLRAHLDVVSSARAS